MLVFARHRIASEAADHDDAQGSPLPLDGHDGSDAQDHNLQGLADLALAPPADKTLTRCAEL